MKTIKKQVSIPDLKHYRRQTGLLCEDLKSRLVIETAKTKKRLQRLKKASKFGYIAFKAMYKSEK